MFLDRIILNQQFTLSQSNPLTQLCFNFHFSPEASISTRCSSSLPASLLSWLLPPPSLRTATPGPSLVISLLCLRSVAKVKFCPAATPTTSMLGRRMITITTNDGWTRSKNSTTYWRKLVVSLATKPATGKRAPSAPASLPAALAMANK